MRETWRERERERERSESGRDRERKRKMLLRRINKKKIFNFCKRVTIPS